MNWDRPTHQTSMYSGYSNWGIGYSLFESFAWRFRIPLYFERKGSLAFILAFVLRWKRTYFKAQRRSFYSLDAKHWNMNKTVFLGTGQYLPWSKV